MQSFLPARRYALAGVRRVLVTQHVAGTRFVFSDPTIPRITSLVPAPATWYPLTAEPSASATQVGMRTLSGLRYEQKLSLTWTTGFSLYQRRSVPALFEQALWVLVEDMAGSWHLAGQHRGLRCTSLTWSTGARGGDILVSAVLEGAEPAAWLGFDTPLARALYATNTPAGPDPLDPVDVTDTHDEIVVIDDPDL